MELEDIMYKEVGQIHKNKYHIFYHMGRSKSCWYECRLVITGDREGSGEQGIDED